MDDDRIYLKEWRLFADLTQEELGSRLGISGAHVSRLETGKRDFDGAYLRRFKTAINEALEEVDNAPHVRIRHIGHALSLEPDPNEWLLFSPDLQHQLARMLAHHVNRDAIEKEATPRRRRPKLT